MYLRLIIINQQWFCAIVDRALIDNHFSHVLLARQLIHDVQQSVLQDGTQAARPCFTCNRLLRNRMQGSGTDFELRALHFQQLGVLLDQGVFRFDQDLDQGIFIQFVQSRDDRQTTDQFWNQAELDQILRFCILQYFAIAALRLTFHARSKTYAAAL